MAKKGPISVLTALPAAFLIKDAYDVAGGNVMNMGGPLMYRFTGYNMTSGKWDGTRAMATLGIFATGYIGHKIANRIGINKHLSKLTGGWLNL